MKIRCKCGKIVRGIESNDEFFQCPYCLNIIEIKKRNLNG